MKTVALMTVLAVAGCGRAVDGAPSSLGDGGGGSASPGDGVAPRLVAGGGFACAIAADGGVACWGDNDFGQLGNGVTTSTQAAVQVTGLTTGVTALAAGDISACAVTAKGGVWCWGANCGFTEDGGTVCLDNNGASETPASRLMPKIMAPGPVTALASGVTAGGRGKQLRMRAAIARHDRVPRVATSTASAKAAFSVSRGSDSAETEKRAPNWLRFRVMCDPALAQVADVEVESLRARIDVSLASSSGRSSIGP
jgi:hypothetical protein